MKKKPISGHKTKQFGLWYDKHRLNFKSEAISLGKLSDYKGSVRLVICKNRYFNGGENNRPNYIGFFCDVNSEEAQTNELTLEECKRLETGERLYTYSEVQYAIDKATEDARNGYYENIVRDYLN